MWFISISYEQIYKQIGIFIQDWKIAKVLPLIID